MAEITTTAHMGGAGRPPVGAFAYRAPEIQDSPFRTPYDVGDRWQLSRLCAKLGLPHRDAERKAVLIQMLLQAEEAGRIDLRHALGLLDEIIANSTPPKARAPERVWVELEAPAVTGPNGLPLAPAAAPPSPESELWRFAKLNQDDLIAEAQKIGVTLKRTMKRAEMMDALEAALKG